jgi:hypothetical protein
MDSKTHYPKLLIHLFATFILSTLLYFNASAQTNIFQLMERTDLKIDSIEKLATQHFTAVGTGKGSGYKQYQRWLYERKFHIDDKGYYITPEEEDNKFLNFASNQKHNKFNTSTWTEMGPKTWSYTNGWNPGIGRITSVAVHPSDTTKIYVSSPGGGIWKSLNSGKDWAPLTDNTNSSWMNISHITIDPNNQNIIYASLASGGVLKSINAGSTWSMTSSGPSNPRKVLVHPNNSNIIFATAANGIHRSVNAGASWTKVCTSSMEDIEFNPYNPDIMYASSISGTSCVWRSIDNGLNWTAIGATSGITTAGRTLLAVAPNNAAIVYAVQANGSVFGKFYKSTDTGKTYTAIITGSAASGTNFFGYEIDGKGTTGQATYDMAICVNPTNANEVHIAGVISWKSTNGGLTFKAETEWYYPNTTGYNHADIHALEWVGKTIYSGSDGGIYKSVDRGDNWIDLSIGLGIRQIYRIACSPTNSNVIVLGAQDNGTSMRQSSGVWKDWLGADGMDCMISPTDASVAFGTVQRGEMYKTSNAGVTIKYVSNPSTGNWITPLAMHPRSHDTIYAGWNGVWRSNNSGTSWTKISGTSIPYNIDVLTVSPTNVNYIYAAVGSTLYRTSNAGISWSSVTTPAPITSVCVSPNNPEKIWITFNSSVYRVFLSNDMGSNLTDLSSGLPSMSARSIVVDDKSWEGIYVGMNIGVYYRDNVNKSWILHGTGLPFVAINEVEIQKASKKLRIATYGRGVWESDLQDPTYCFAVETTDSSNILDNAVKLHWPAVKDATEYIVEYKTSNSTIWNDRQKTTDTSINLVGLLSQTDYNWRIKTQCLNDSSSSILSNFTTLPSCNAPSNLYSNNISTSGATLNWSNVSGAQSYTVEYKTSASSSWTGTTTLTGNSITLSGLSAGTNYDWNIKTNCSWGSSNIVLSGFTTLSNCNTPTNPYSNSITTNSAIAKWTVVSGSLGYSVEYKPASSSTWIFAGTTTNNNFPISDLTSGLTYNWRVQNNCNGNSSTYLQSSFTTNCAEVTNIISSNVTPTSATISWNATSGAINYLVEYKLATALTWNVLGYATKSTYTLSNLKVDTEYEFRIRTRCSANNSPYVVYKFKTNVGCLAPGSLTVNNIKNDSVTLRWAEATDATSYVVEYKVAGSSNWTGTSTITGLSQVISSLSAGTSYDWQIKSSCPVGFSSFAQSAFETSCDVPTNPVANNITFKSAQLNWDAAYGATNYIVEFKPSTSSKWFISKPVTTPSIIINELNSGVNYDWRVRTNCYAQTPTYLESTFTTLCVAPIQLANNSVQFDGATLGWLKLGPAKTFTFEYKLNSDTTWNSVSDLTNPNYSVTNLLSGNKYNWRVKNVCAVNESDYTSSTFTTLCIAPEQASAANLTSSTADLNWNAVNGAKSYQVDYQLASDNHWTSLSANTSNQISLTNLSTGLYNWRVSTNCPEQTSNSLVSNFILYCGSQSEGKNTEYIRFVNLGSISRTSLNDNGYFYGLNHNTILYPGTEYLLNFAPGFSSEQKTEYWSIFIDYNRNGSFTESNELVGQYITSDSALASLIFTAPSVVEHGNTRMRISMKHDDYPTPCNYFADGEVEDYSITLTSLPMAPPKIKDGESISDLVVYPVPSNSYLFYSYSLSAETTNLDLQVTDMAGKQLLTKKYSEIQGTYTDKLDVSSYSPGIYFLSIKTPNGLKVTKFMVAGK